MSNKLSIGQGWSLFLDRDGVINQRIADDYVKLPEDFEFIPGVTQALKIFAVLFSPIVVITNQQGIGRGLMTDSQLNLVHQKMLQKVTENGGRIDAVFYSPDLKNTGSFTRKPSVGLGLKARKQFPGINFKRSIMAGDSYSDILFGYRLGMVTVLIGTDKEVAFKCAGMLQYSFPDLISFAEYVKENIPAKA
ncbi:MAG: HAD-IIIA family hydrolase [Bacteroidales bacterium]|nr:HAD-IIIA family hydrolase [Bacteroidales bacterium]